MHTDDIFSVANSEVEAQKSMTDFDRWDWKDVKEKGFLVGLTIKYLEDGVLASCKHHSS